MTDSMLDRTEALRQEAYEDLQGSEQFRAFKALDDAVAAMGGKRQLAVLGDISIALISSKAPGAEPKTRQRKRRRVSQGDAAEIVLNEKARPMTSAELLAVVPEKGVTVGGKDAQMNFGSTLSRDPRFYSYRRDGLYYWWLKAKPLPARTNEAPDLALHAGSGASPSKSNQEGGEGHAATSLNPSP